MAAQWRQECLALLWLLPAMTDYARSTSRRTNNDGVAVGSCCNHLKAFFF